MKTRTWWSVIVVLLIVIVAMAWILFATPTPAHAPTTAISSTQTSAPAPLHNRVFVSSPQAGATVGQTFTVSGEAPGNWYFEAVFPIEVIGYGMDNDPIVLAHAQGYAQGEWTTTAQVPFSAGVTLDTPYHGHATLVLLKDNPSGLPENDDSLEVPIVIQ